MPVDSTIPLRGNAPASINALEVLGNVAELRRLKMQEQEQAMRMGELQRQQRAQEQMRGVFQKARTPEGEMDWNVAAREAMTVDPEMGMKLQAQIGAMSKAQQEAARAELETTQKKLDMWASATGSLQAVKPEMRPQAWGQVVSQLEGLGIVPRGALDPAQYPGDQAIAMWQQNGLSAKEQVDAAQKAIDDALNADKFAEEQRQFGVTEGRQSATAAEAARHNRATEGQAAAELAFNKTKPTATGGNRPVTSGDAGRMTELNSSLNDVAVLRNTLSGTGGTGIMPSVGAAMPAWATNLTGWGTAAKERQAVIDRVKQVIGKALEGGVLRKEDEIKYTKILPTISDPPAVAKAKIDGLDAAIALKRQTFVDALADAGYNTTNFEARQAQPPRTTAPRVGEQRTINGQPARWDGKGWLPAGR